MHFANGRPALNGDRVLRVGPNCYAKPIIGILHDAVPGNDACNGNLAAPIADQGYCNLAECLHMDDVKALLGDITKVPDSSAPAPDPIVVADAEDPVIVPDDAAAPEVVPDPVVPPDPAPAEVPAT